MGTYFRISKNIISYCQIVKIVFVIYDFMRDGKIITRRDPPIPCNRIFLEKLTVAQLVNNFPAFYGTLKFLQCSKESATGPCSELDESSSNSHIFFNIHFNIILLSTPLPAKLYLPF
jgi:hypothetical protein